MRIDNYDMALNSCRTYEQRDESMEELREWGPRKKTDEKEISEPEAGKHRKDHISISAMAKQAFAAQISQNQAGFDPSVNEYDPDEEIEGDAKLMTLKRMVEFFTGRKINLSSAASVGNGSDSGENVNQGGEKAQAPEESEQGWGMSYSSYQSHYEYEQTSFSAGGTVKTADGKEIQFSLELQMSREYFSEERFEMTAGEPLIDPLVINYSGGAAELSDMKFEFDLTADGNKEEISYLKPGVGFLVFDKNEDGKINDGSEMFGPSTGNGFSELAAYDEDKNNWIDENDSIYQKLALWHKSNNVDSLVNLREANVGAIYLGNVDSQFDLKDSANGLNGRIQRSGVYLSENGVAGAVQQLDFSI